MDDILKEIVKGLSYYYGYPGHPPGINSSSYPNDHLCDKLFEFDQANESSTEVFAVLIEDQCDAEWYNYNDLVRLRYIERQYEDYLIDITGSKRPLRTVYLKGKE